jgi:hypothetical protein
MLSDHTFIKCQNIQPFLDPANRSKIVTIKTERFKFKLERTLSNFHNGRNEDSRDRVLAFQSIQVFEFSMVPYIILTMLFKIVYA